MRHPRAIKGEECDVVPRYSNTRSPKSMEKTYKAAKGGEGGVSLMFQPVIGMKRMHPVTALPSPASNLLHSKRLQCY